MNHIADRVDDADELCLLARTDASEWGVADLSDVLLQLDGWLVRLDRDMAAGLPLTLKDRT